MRIKYSLFPSYCNGISTPHACASTASWHEYKLVNRERDGVIELKQDATDAGATAGRARHVIEQDLGRSIVSPQNARTFTKPQPQVGAPGSVPTDEHVPPANDADAPTQLPLFLDFT
jgi:hypothetical protein